MGCQIIGIAVVQNNTNLTTNEDEKEIEGSGQK